MCCFFSLYLGLYWYCRLIKPDGKSYLQVFAQGLDLWKLVSNQIIRSHEFAGISNCLTEEDFKCSIRNKKQKRLFYVQGFSLLLWYKYSIKSPPYLRMMRSDVTSFLKESYFCTKFWASPVIKFRHGFCTLLARDMSWLLTQISLWNWYSYPCSHKRTLFMKLFRWHNGNTLRKFYHSSGFIIF